MLLIWFLKCVTVRNPGRIVLKLPPHTCRIRVLLEMFPQAKFVHIVRDQYVVFPSTVNLWKRLYRDEGWQLPKYRGLDDHVFKTLTRMYEAFERDRELLGTGINSARYVTKTWLPTRWERCSRSTSSSG